MPLRHKRTRWQQHPVVAKGGYAASLKFLQLGDLPRDLITGIQRTTGVGTPGAGAGQMGRVRTYSSSSDYYAGNVAMDAALSYTVLLVCEVTTLDGFAGLFAHTTALDTSLGFAIINGINVYGGDNTNTATGISPGDIVNVGRPVRIAFSFDNASDRWASFQDGRLKGSGTLAGLVPTPGSGYIKVFASRDTDATSGRCYLAGAWDQALPDAALMSLTTNPWQLCEPRKRRIWPSATVQYLRPTSDISAGAWTPSSGVDLYAMLDETTASDADYDVTSSPSTFEVKFGTGIDPVSSAGHIVRYRAKGTGSLTVTLRQGASLIATHTPTLTTSYQTFDFTLSGAEADQISDYGDLRLRFVSS